MKKQKKNPNERAEVSEYNPVPLYRAYGSTKKEYKLWEEFLAFIQKAFTVIIIGLLAFAFGVAIFAWMRYGGILVQTAVTVAVFLILFFTFTKTLRKRISLNRKLKKVCAENRFDLKFERSTIESLKWSENKSDITIVTPNNIFYIRLLAVPKYRCHICFDSAAELRIVKPPLNNKFTVIFDFKTKTKTLSLDFSDAREFEGKKTRKIIIVNPVCGEMYYKVSQISTAQTGNGGEHFGYQVFTASGFINYLKRIDEVSREESKILH